MPVGTLHHNESKTRLRTCTYLAAFFFTTSVQTFSVTVFDGFLFPWDFDTKAFSQQQDSHDQHTRKVFYECAGTDFDFDVLGENESKDRKMPDQKRKVNSAGTILT